MCLILTNIQVKSVVDGFTYHVVSQQLMPILSAVMTTSGDMSLAHTSHIRPSFETIVSQSIAL